MPRGKAARQLRDSSSGSHTLVSSSHEEHENFERISQEITDAVGEGIDVADLGTEEGDAAYKLIDPTRKQAHKRATVSKDGCSFRICSAIQCSIGAKWTTGWRAYALAIIFLVFVAALLVVIDLVVRHHILAATAPLPVAAAGNTTSGTRRN